MGLKTLGQKRQEDREWFVVLVGFCAPEHGDVYPNEVVDLDANYARTQLHIQRIRPLTEDEHEALKPERREGKKFTLAVKGKAPKEPVKTDAGGGSGTGGTPDPKGGDGKGKDGKTK